MSVVLIDQQIVHYEVLGRGRPLIFIHGWVGSWRYWIPVMQTASMSFRAYAIDLWGFGDSAKLSDNYSLNQQVMLVDKFLYEMGIGRVALIGHGLGAVVATQYALRNPDIVDRVMAIGFPMDEAKINTRLRTSPPAELADWLLGRNAITEPVLTDAPKTDQRAIATSLTSLGGVDVMDGTTRLTTPCLLVSGQNDQAVSSPDLDSLVSLPEQTHAISFEQSGHFPMLDEGSKFNRLLIDFLSLPSGESPRQLQLKEEWKRRVR
jgi:pimeloyl-ACP methyl ester carboxylesterase